MNLKIIIFSYKFLTLFFLSLYLTDGKPSNELSKDLSLIEGTDIIQNTNIKHELSKKKYTVLYFLSTTCPCSKKHFDYIKHLKTKFSNIAQFIGIHSNKSVSLERARNYLKNFNLNFPVLFDQDLKLANRFKAVKTPHFFILNNLKDILYFGAATNSRTPENATNKYLEDALERLRENREIKIKRSKTLGCYIQR